MAFQVPPMPSELIEALKRQNPAQPPVAPGIAPGAMPMRPPSPGVPAQTPAVPPVTDDPAVTQSKPGVSSYLNMPTLPKPPDYSNSPVTSAYSAYQDTASKQAALQAPKPADYKPSLWDRLKGGAVGALVGGLSENADKGAAAGSRFTYAKYNHAAGDYGREKAHLGEELETQQKGAGLAEAAGRIPQTDFENRLQISREQRLQQTEISNAEYKDSIASIKNEIAKGNIEKAQNQLDQQQKALEEKKEHDKDWYEMQHAMLDIRQQIADRGDKPKPGQVNATENAKSQAIAKAHAQYAKATQGLPTDPKAQWTEEQRGQLQAAKEAYDQATQDAQDAYEAKVNETGGTAPHQDVTSSPSWTGKGQPTTPAQEALPTVMGPAGEKPLKTGNGGKFGFYKSTGQWMAVPQQEKK